jgi:Zn-dependent M16 (insulinase) family peptidase
MRTGLRIILGTTLLLCLAAIAALGAPNNYDKLNQGEVIAQFTTEAVYFNADHQAVGARFRHVPSGYVLDVLAIQSAPQAFMWVNSVPPSDQGEPHTCEHLLLGKGTKGRYVASLENMSLGQSSAYTMQLQTCYHLNTSAGPDVFFNLFKEQLDALIHPTYSDEEIRREVCNMGIRLDPSDSSLHLEEKGTVYNEMVSGFESPYGHMYFELGRMVYGLGHPLSLDAGGFPDSIRNMVPNDLRTFHDRAYHLNNMGSIVALPDNITPEDCLTRLSGIFAGIEPDAKSGDDPARLGDRLPPLRPAEPGSVAMTAYQAQDPQEPGQLVFAWPAQLTLDPRERYLMELFIANLAGDETSILYRKLVDTKTRMINTGAAGVSGWVSTDPGFGPYISLYNVDRDFLTRPMIDSLRRVVEREFAAVAGLAPGSPEFTAFVDQMKSKMIERKRDLRVFLNQPPRFGYRGTGSEWFYSLQRTADNGGFNRSLLLDNEFAFVDSLLATDKNFWPEFITKWHLSVTPYASAALSDTTLLAKNEADRKARVDKFTVNLKKQYGVTTEVDAIKRFKQDYDLKTAEIDEIAKKIPMPTFISNPPMTLDEQLRYRAEKIGVVPSIVSTFENLSGGTVGFASNADVVPESLLVYLPALPTLLTSVGATKDGKVYSYTDMREALRREILGLNIYYSTNYRTQRVEFVARASGSDLGETQAALGWLQAVLHDADLRPENLDRIRDAIDQALAGNRNRMRGSEESWVDEPAMAYWRQSNPLLLTTDCFLTQIHALHRLRWLLREPASPQIAEQFKMFMQSLDKAASTEALKSSGNGVIRGPLAKLLDSLDQVYTPASSTTQANDGKDAIRDAIADMKRNLADIPDENLVADWSYLCNQILHDYNVPAKQALEQIKLTLSLLLNKSDVRAFIIASSATQDKIKPAVSAIIDGYPSSPVVHRKYSDAPLIVGRLRQRFPDLNTPLYVGLINDNTRSGVHYNTANCASYLDTSSAKLLDFLSARLYGGGGAHSMFMKTWGAGLAYSNGLRSSESSGRIIYYAERCPDLAQTIQFVVNELKNAPHDSSLASYAVAQAFAGSRAAANYEARGEAIASELVDGNGPEIVTRFRQNILSLANGPSFYDKIQSRMESVYGLVLPGYGPSAVEALKSADANYFVIGPEAQMKSYEKYLQQAESGAKLYRIYPRDYWITLKL